MAPSDSTKVALGVLLLASFGVTVYFLTKHIRRKRKANERNDESSSALGTHDSSEETDPKTLFEGKKEAHVGQTESGSTMVAKENSVSGAEEVSEPVLASESITPAEMTSFTESMTSWEQVKPMSESFVEVKPSSLSETQGAEAGDTVTSKIGQDSLGSFIDLATSKESSKQESSEDLGGGDKHGSDNSSVVKGRVSSFTDDVQSLKSEDTSSGEAPSFEQINGSDDATSLTGSDGVEGAENRSDIHFFPPNPQPQLTESLQSFEQLTRDSLNQKTGSVSESMSSFNKVDESDKAVSMNPLDSSSIIVIPESLKESIQSEEIAQSKVKESACTEEGKPMSGEQTEESRPPTEEKASSVKEEVSQCQGADAQCEGTKLKPQTEELKPDVETSKSKAEETGSQTAAVSSQSGETESNSQSFEMVEKKGLGGSSENYYSNESLQSFATATSGSSKQDFYSPIGSPRTTNSSFDNTSFKSFDDSTSYDSDVSKEMTFYDVESAGGRNTPLSPQDRTPTNTPVPQEFGGGDAESAKTPVEWMKSALEESVIADDGSQENQDGEGEAVESESGSSESLLLKDKPPETSVADTPIGEESSVKPMLPIDKDKMTQAILQAQNRPDHLEIGHLQILVELLKQDDRTLLNTTLQCLLRVTAFTINVNILTVCEAPKELVRLLKKFGTLIVNGQKPSGQSSIGGAPSPEALFLNTARVVNNFAMDMKSQTQLEDSIPALTDLLMTEGISETVTLASLQPLTNMSSTDTYHGQYTRLLQQLYSFLDTSQSSHLRLQCLKLLVNLSLNADMVPHMLAAKAPSSLLDLLDINYDVELLLRSVTFLANVMTIMQERSLSPSKLPPDEKAASPETLLSALTSHQHRDTIRNKVYRLTRHDSQDVSYQASRLYKCVVSSK